jgi:nucleoside-diphosphate-sugar epimerase
MLDIPILNPQSGSNPKRILIFGANGVFGRRTLRRLSTIQNLELRAVCRFQEQANQLADTFGPRVIPLQGNVNNLGQVRMLSKGVDAIFHCAGPFSRQPLYPLTVALENDIDYADLGDDPTIRLHQRFGRVG